MDRCLKCCVVITPKSDMQFCNFTDLNVELATRMGHCMLRNCAPIWHTTCKQSTNVLKLGFRILRPSMLSICIS